MRALVLGGAGYIGSHMVRALARARHGVAVFDNFSTGHREAVAGQQLYEGELLSTPDLDRALGDFKPDVVLHFAARSLVAESMVEPALYYENNVCGTHNLLQALRRHGVGRLVFSSTAAAYGNPQYSPIDEQHPLQPINPYGWSKRFAEQMIADHCRSHGLRAAVLRYFNAAGADAEGDIGEAHEPETHLIPNVLLVAAGRKPQLTIFGSDFDTADGYCVRDFIHVTDLCDAHMLAAEALEQTALPAFQVYNLGNGQGFSVREVLATAEQVVGQRIPHQIGPRRAGDPASLVASARQARQQLAWTPQLADLGTIVESAWRWHRRPRY